MSKAYKGIAMEGSVARWYTKNTKGDTRFAGIADKIAREVPAGGRILEVAPGPGYLAIELARRGYRVSGLDISRSFVDIAGLNAQEAGVTLDLHLGDAAHMPLPDATFDHVICTAAFKNFTDPVGALGEMKRVLKPGGTASIVDLRKDASAADIDAEVRSMGLSAINALMTKVTFRTFLLRSAHSRADLERMAKEAGWEAFETVEEGIGIELRLAKRAEVPTS